MNWRENTRPQGGTCNTLHFGSSSVSVFAVFFLCLFVPDSPHSLRFFPYVTSALPDYLHHCLAICLLFRFRLFCVILCVRVLLSDVLLRFLPYTVPCLGFRPLFSVYLRLRSLSCVVLRGRV